MRFKKELVFESKSASKSVSEAVAETEKKDVDLDQALDVVGLGWYNLTYCLVLASFLMTAIIESVGYSYVLPTAKCDLDMSDSQRGLIASLPYIAIVITAFPWGYLLDTRGRKSMLVISSILAGIFGTLASLMPNLISFTIFKFIASICMTCPAVAPYPFIGEILPVRHRDIALTITNALQLTGAAFVPLIAWGILPLDFSWNVGLYDYRSWRLLSMIYSLTFIASGIFMSFGMESPKFLVAQGKHDEALDVLKRMYAINHRKSAESYPVKRLKMPEQNNQSESFFKSLKSQTLPLLKPNYLKWLCLNGFLLFGIFASLNGLFMWVPDILNRVFSNNNTESMTACQVIRQRFEDTDSESETVCIDTMDEITYIINTIANFCCVIATLAISLLLKVVGKKAILVATYMIIGVLCILVNFTTIPMLFAAQLVTLQMLALGIGPINAYSIHIFPTFLRGMAVSLSMMLGRVGSVVGTNVAGLLINTSCESTFYLFGGILLVCGLMSFLLPRGK